MRKKYKFLPGIEGGYGGCLHCGYKYEHLPSWTLIAVGCGDASVTKDGKEIYNELNIKNEKFWTCRKAEFQARKDPDHDWRIHLVASLSERHYQRQGKNIWVLYEKGLGFA